MRQLCLNTTCVVGHGGSGAADKGMNVNQQKRVLEEIKQYQYQVSFLHDYHNIINI